MYNVKRLDYASGYQLRIYQQPIAENGKEKDKISQDEKDKQEEERGQKSEQRTEEQREHSENASVNRTIQSVYGIARANMWEYFITLTFNPEKIDRSDYNKVKSAGVQWLKNIKKRYCPDLKYLVVPELHKDGINWHLHGLIANCAGLDLVDSGHKKNDKPIYNLPQFRYGFSTASAIESQSKSCSYITKYITKDVCSAIPNAQRYCASRNCIRLKDVTTNLNLTPEQVQELLGSCSPDYIFCKEQIVPDAGQRVMYIDYTNSQEDANV